MSGKRPVVVYGASGFSGRLVAEFLREYKVPFIAAGRDGAKIEEVLGGVPGIATADYEVVQVAPRRRRARRAVRRRARREQFRRSLLPLRRDRRRGRAARRLPLHRHRRGDAVGAPGEGGVG